MNTIANSFKETPPPTFKDDPLFGRVTYDFTGKDPGAVLTADERAHLKEGMLPRNFSGSIARDPAEIDFARAAEAVRGDLQRLFP